MPGGPGWRSALVVLAAATSLAGCGILDALLGRGDDDGPVHPPIETPVGPPVLPEGVVSCPVDAGEMSCEEGLAYIHEGRVYIFCSQRCLDEFVATH